MNQSSILIGEQQEATQLILTHKDSQIIAKNNENDCSFYWSLFSGRLYWCYLGTKLKLATPEVTAQQMRLYYQLGIENTLFVAGVCLFVDFCCTALIVLLYILLTRKDPNGRP